MSFRCIENDGNFSKCLNTMLRKRDEQGFKEFLSERQIRPGDKRYAAAMSAFWNLVRSTENEPSR
jgi:hypothetical protein